MTVDRVLLFAPFAVALGLVPLACSAAVAGNATDGSSPATSDGTTETSAADAGTAPDADARADATTEGDVGADARADAATDGDAGADAGNDGSIVVDGAADAGKSVAIYVANYLGGIVAYTLDPVTGMPKQVDGSPFDVDAAFNMIALGPDGTHVYAADDHHFVHGYSIAEGGALSPLPQSPYPTPGAPLSMGFDPLGRFAYVGNINSTSDTILVMAVHSDGSLSALGDGGTPVHGAPTFVAAEPSGRFLYATQVGAGAGIHAYSVTDGGDVSEVDGGPFGASAVFGGAIVFSPDGRFLYAGHVSAFAIDPASGALSEVGTLPANVSSDLNALDLAIDPGGRHVYGVDRADGTVFVMAIDTDAGTLQSIAGSPFDGGPTAYSVAVDPGGRFFAVGNDDEGKFSLFVVDPATGAIQSVPGSPFPEYGLQPQIVIARYGP
jgi:6-phosphogluconolactonase (cycloisomerase 2 family)